jgi:ubiquinone/menaquinone biosynthesis C-methylase UbiE
MSTVERRLELQRERAGALGERVRELLAPFRGDERALDSGCGTGAFAFALAPYVREVVGVDSSPDLLAAGRTDAPPNVTLLEGDATSLPFDIGEFDLSGCLRVLHHVRRPELVVSELARVTRPGGRLLVVDQLADIDPLRAIDVDRFERARDSSHVRLLSDADIRGLLDANGLVVTRNEVKLEQRDLERYLDLASVPEGERSKVRGLAPGARYEVEVGWYVARKHRLR